LLYFNTWGILNAFGAYQTYYESGKLFTTTPSNISWIGSIAAFMLLFVGIFVGPLYDRGHLRTLLVFGSFMVVLGHMMISICNAYWQVVLAQGFGGVIYPIVLYRLIEKVGFAWAVRVMGFISLGTLAIPLAAMRMRVKPPKTRAMLDASSLTDVPYMAFVLTTLVTYTGLFAIIFFLSYFAEANRITDASLAFYLVPIFNAASILGRLLPNALADKVGAFNLLIPSAIASGLLMLCMIAVHSKGAVIVIALLSGFFSGALIGLPPVCLAMLTPDKSRLGSRIGMGYAIIALGVLVSGPAGGAVLNNGGGQLHWDKLWVFGGVLTAVSSVGFVMVRVMKYGTSLNKKA
jgi:predicted MFS family arabinose efflux permease